MKRADDVLYHMDPKKPEDEELGFNTVAGYNTFCNITACGKRMLRVLL